MVGIESKTDYRIYFRRKQQKNTNTKEKNVILISNIGFTKYKYNINRYIIMLII